MTDFLSAYQNTMSHEGSYSNDPRDRGGETWYGIARNFQPDWEGWIIIDEVKANAGDQFIKALQEDEELSGLVMRFYNDEFFNRLLLSEFDQEIANELFDTAVNQGVGTAGRCLQEALNLLNNNQKHYPDLILDGKPGMKTLAAYRAYMETAKFSGRSHEKNIKTLLKCLNGLQFLKYIQIVKKSPGQEVYFYGWVNRV
jgi:lysozyme family protein